MKYCIVFYIISDSGEAKKSPLSNYGVLRVYLLLLVGFFFHFLCCSPNYIYGCGGNQTIWKHWVILKIIFFPKGHLCEINYHSYVCSVCIWLELKCWEMNSESPSTSSKIATASLLWGLLASKATVISFACYSGLVEACFYVLFVFLSLFFSAVMSAYWYVHSSSYCGFCFACFFALMLHLFSIVICILYYIIHNYLFLAVAVLVMFGVCSWHTVSVALMCLGAAHGMLIR